jgi:hypothetical protein
MNKVAGAVCGVPLERWLRNAAYDAKLKSDLQRYFSDLADEVVNAVLPPSLAGIYRPIANVAIASLKAILTGDLKRGSADFSLLREQGDQSILCLLREIRKQALTRELLEALRKARPDDQAFAATIATALQALEQEPPDQPDPAAILGPVETTDDVPTILRKALRSANGDVRPVTVTTQNQDKFVGSLMADTSGDGVALLGWFQLSQPQDDALRQQLTQLLDNNRLFDALELARQHHIEPEMRNPIRSLSSNGALVLTAETVRLFPRTDILRSSKDTIPDLQDERPLMWATP